MKVLIRYGSPTLDDKEYTGVTRVSRNEIADTGFLTIHQGEDIILIRASIIDFIAIEGGVLDHES